MFFLLLLSRKQLKAQYTLCLLPFAYWLSRGEYRIRTDDPLLAKQVL